MKVLIVSPFFVPVNTPDLHRVRQLVPFFKEHQWDVVVYSIDESYVSFNKEEGLLDTIPQELEIVKVKPNNSVLYKLFGINNIALRSIFSLHKSVRQRIENEKIDLVFFSTTSFPVTVLGRIWKSQFSVPYIIDMQDPWRSDHYWHSPKSKRPAKFYLSYLLDSILEWYAITAASGILSVNKKYIEVLKNRYRKITRIPELIMPFGYAEVDFEVSAGVGLGSIVFSPNKINIVYVGRVNGGMIPACEILFKIIQVGLSQEIKLFSDLKLYFVGTSYATIADESSRVDIIASKYLPPEMIEVYPERIGYLNAIQTIKEAEIVFMPGSVDGDYVASKMLNILYMNKKVFAISNSKSEVVDLLKESTEVEYIFLDEAQDMGFYLDAVEKLQRLIQREPKKEGNVNLLTYNAKHQSAQLIQLFNEVVNNNIH